MRPCSLTLGPNCVFALVLTMFLLLPSSSPCQESSDYVEIFAQAIVEGSNDETPQVATETASKPAKPVPTSKQQPSKTHKTWSKSERHPKVTGMRLKALKVAGKFVGAATTLCVILSALLFWALSQVLFSAFCLSTAPPHRERLQAVYDLTKSRPWKTLFLGILNAALCILAIVILLKIPVLGIFGIIAIAWFIYRLLETLSTRAVQMGITYRQGPNASKHFGKTVLVGSLLLWPMMFIPVLGQALGLLWLLQGFGAIVWLRWRSPAKKNTDTTAEVVTTSDEESTKPPVNQKD